MSLLKLISYFVYPKKRANLFEMRKKIKLLTSNLKMFITDSGSSLPGMLADVNKFISKQQTNIGEFKEIYSSTV